MHDRGTSAAAISGFVERQWTSESGPKGMGYIIAIVLLLVVVPLLFIMLSRRPTGAGTLDAGRRSGGFTPSQPSADAPTPQQNSINQRPEAERRLPPG